jgi:hypothetical protein
MAAAVHSATIPLLFLILGIVCPPVFVQGDEG